MLLLFWTLACIYRIKVYKNSLKISSKFCIYTTSIYTTRHLYNGKFYIRFDTYKFAPSNTLLSKRSRIYTAYTYEPETSTLRCYMACDPNRYTTHHSKRLLDFGFSRTRLSYHNFTLFQCHLLYFCAYRWEPRPIMDNAESRISTR